MIRQRVEWSKIVFFEIGETLRFRAFQHSPPVVTILVLSTLIGFALEWLIMPI